jgi:ethanolamine utilization protein EutQ (cupin superfamily)
MSVTVVKSKLINSDLEVYSPGILHKQAIKFPEGDNLSIGYYKVTPGIPYNMDMHFEEIDYAIEGSAIILDETGTKHTVEKGDIFYLRKGSKISIASEEGFRGIYIFPYNRQ